MRKDTAGGVVLLLLALMFSAVRPVMARGEWITHAYGPHALVGRLDTSDVPESSGLIASRLNPGLYWTHNDSGRYAPRVWAFRLNEADIAAGTPRARGYIHLINATLIDWEDISAGPGNTIYILDGGDNPPCHRTNKRIYRFTEPVIDPEGEPVAMNMRAESVRFDYPAGGNPAAPAEDDADRYDCEAMMVHPFTGDIYLVTKRDTDRQGVARVYRLTEADLIWNSPDIHVLEFVTDLTSRIRANSFFGQVTAGDIDAAGRRIVLRNYAPTAVEFVLPRGEPFQDIFAQTPKPISLGPFMNEGQGEAIAYAADGGDLITTAEDDPMPVFRTPWALANVRVRRLRRDEATIRWETAMPAASRVDYGRTPDYDRQVMHPEAATEHVVTLSEVMPETLYYFRVTSDMLVYPPPGRPSEAVFTTLAGLAADFDEDGDVDMVDFAYLQSCLSGADIVQRDPGCYRALLNEDDVVDAEDIAIFAGCLSGPGIMADPDCE